MARKKWRQDRNYAYVHFRIQSDAKPFEYAACGRENLRIRKKIFAEKKIPDTCGHGLIYQALIQPHFDYCCTVWGTCGVTLQDKLQKLQNRATRVLTFSNYDVNAGQLLEILGWKNLDRKRNIQKVTVVFKCLHGLALDYFRIEAFWTKYKLQFEGLRLRTNLMTVRTPRTNSFS